jgi:hypothetical protein
MPYKQGVTGSNPVVPTLKLTTYKVKLVGGFLLYTQFIQNAAFAPLCGSSGGSLVPRLTGAVGQGIQ